MDHIILLAMWQSASRAGLLPRLVGYSGEKYIPYFDLEFYVINIVLNIVYNRSNTTIDIRQSNIYDTTELHQGRI